MDDDCHFATSQNSSNKALQGVRKVFLLSAQHVVITESAIKIAYLICGLKKL